MDRRAFLGSVGATGAAAVMAGVSPGGAAPTHLSVREEWVERLQRVAHPVLTNLAGGTLKARMPVEQAPQADRRGVTYLEACGRLVSGLAPWVALPADESPEGRLRARYLALTQQAIERAVDPASPDYMNFTTDRQPLVDAAFLGQGILRAPRALGEALSARTRRHLVTALESTRTITPYPSNWLLFSATVEATLARLGASWDRLRVDYALRQHDQWYRGDGIYGDGPDVHADYYNSFVIHPMLVDVLETCRREVPAWTELADRVHVRAQRYAAILERVIAPDGSFPAVGRSLAYRCGAFHLLAQSALRSSLPAEVAPAQVRGALTAVIHRTLDAPGTFDSDGWLRIGLCGHQPSVGESYISTGSLYLCATAFLPLGLVASDPFWSAPDCPWTAVKAWSGQATPIDHATSG